MNNTIDPADTPDLPVTPPETYDEDAPAGPPERHRTYEIHMAAALLLYLGLMFGLGIWIDNARTEAQVLLDPVMLVVSGLMGANVYPKLRPS